MKRILLNNYAEKLNDKDRVKLQEFRVERKQISYKTVFQFIETIHCYIKNLFLNNTSELNFYDYFKLNEYKLFLSNPNKFTIKPLFISFSDNFKFTIRTFEKFRTNEYRTNFNCNEYKLLKESVKIRNRITHPKHSKNLIITDDELDKVKTSHNWFFSIINELQNNEKY